MKPQSDRFAQAQSTMDMFVTTGEFYIGNYIREYFSEKEYRDLAGFAAENLELRKGDLEGKIAGSGIHDSTQLNLHVIKQSSENEIEQILNREHPNLVSIFEQENNYIKLEPILMEGRRLGRLRFVSYKKYGDRIVSVHDDNSRFKKLEEYGLEFAQAENINSWNMLVQGGPLILNIFYKYFNDVEKKNLDKKYGTDLLYGQSSYPIHSLSKLPLKTLEIEDGDMFSFNSTLPHFFSIPKKNRSKSDVILLNGYFAEVDRRAHDGRSIIQFIS